MRAPSLLLVRPCLTGTPGLEERRVLGDVSQALERRGEREAEEASEHAGQTQEQSGLVARVDAAPRDEAV